MKVAIFSPYATVVPHFDTELDIAQQHLDRGDSIEFINCMGSLANCDFNQDRDPARCDQCIGRRQMGLELLQPNVSSFTFADDLHELSAIQSNFESIEELRAYQIEGFDIGYAALSSLVSICRDPEPDLTVHRDLLVRFLNSAWQTYRRTNSYLAQHRPDRVYVFNGRFAAMRAVFRACQLANVECHLHERGCDREHYGITINHLLHEIPATAQVIENTWRDAEGDPSRHEIATQWYLDRVHRVETCWKSFVKDQQPGKLPANWDANRKNIVIFSSSDDEFVAIGDCWINQLYPNQVDAIARIAQSLLATAPEIRLTVRVHPNLKDVSNKRKSELLNLKIPNLTVVAPEAAVDSYELMRSSDTVVSFGSSVGIEAVFWNRPSILLGPCFYQDLGGVYVPRDHDQTIALMTRSLEPLPKTGALMYGYWLQTRGHRHQYFAASGMNDGTFKGQTLYARQKKSLAKRIRQRTKKLIRRFAG